MGGEILLYTVCIITLRCTCELFPPRLTRPIHNRVTGVKVLPVIAVAAPRTSPNIVRPPIYHLCSATLLEGHLLSLSYDAPGSATHGPTLLQAPDPCRLIIARLLNDKTSYPSTTAFYTSEREITR